MRKCPFCAAAASADPCPTCGARQEEMLALVGVDEERASAEQGIFDLTARATSLQQQRAALVATVTARRSQDLGYLGTGGESPESAALPPQQWPVLPAKGSSSFQIPEWRPESIGKMMLVLGVSLLGIAGVVFAAVSWPRMDDGQRAILLALATVLAWGLALFLRKRLPLTSESLTGLSLVMLIVDWIALRRAGVGVGLTIQLWWAIGLFAFGGISLVVAALANQRVPRAAAMLILPASGVSLSLALFADVQAQLVGVAIAATLAALAPWLLRGRTGWAWGWYAALASAATIEFVAVLIGLGQISVSDWSAAFASAVMLLAFSAPPAVASMALGDPCDGVRPIDQKQLATARAWLTFFAAGGVFAAITVLLAVPLDGVTLVAALAMIATGVAGLARFGPTVLTRGLRALSFGVTGLAMCYGTAPLVATLAGLVTNHSDVWSEGFGVPTSQVLSNAMSPVIAGPTGPLEIGIVIVWLAVCATGLIAIIPTRRPALVVRSLGYFAVVVGIGAAATMLPVAAQWPMAGAVALSLGVAAAAILWSEYLDRPPQDEPSDVPAVAETSSPRPSLSILYAIGLASACAFVALAWASSSKVATVLAIWVVAILSATGAVRWRSRTLRTAGLAVGVVVSVVAVWVTALAGGSTLSWAAVTAAWAAAGIACGLSWVPVSRRASGEGASLDAGVLVAGALVAAAWVASGPMGTNRFGPMIAATIAVGLGALIVGSAPVRRAERPGLFGLAVASLVALAVEVPSAVGASRSALAWSVFLVSAGLFLLGVHPLARGPFGLAMEIVGLGGTILAVGLSFDSGAGTLSMQTPALLTAMVPVLCVGAIRSERRPYAVVAGGTALLSIWAWLAWAEVTLVEAYTLPAAALALVAGFVLRHGSREQSSWMSYGPGLLLALGPSLFLVLSGQSAWRPAPLMIAAVLVVLAGVRHRLQAPIVLGGATLTILAVHLLWPVAARVERWIILAVAGAVFVWIGATIEKRRHDVENVREAFRTLG